MSTLPASPRIRVFVVDDSAVVRKHLSDRLAADGFDVIGTASDPLFAWPKLCASWPDVIVLDVEMPRMDGITFLRKLMAERPTPVVMCSTLTERGCATTMQAMAEGAVGFVTKPRAGLSEFLDDAGNGLAAAVRAAARANLGGLRTGPSTSLAARRAPRPEAMSASPASSPLASSRPAGAMACTTDRLIAIGVSTGGVQALETVLVDLDRQTPGLVIVQHMPERFTASLAARLDEMCEIEVREARDGDRVLQGRALIAPGGRHLTVRRSGAQYVVDIKDGPPIKHHKPSVDVMMRSVAQCAGRNALGVIMTGMGDDGAIGLREMHAAGARTAAQDEASCVVYGMPAEAVRAGAVDDVVPLAGMAAWIRRHGSADAAPRQNKETA